MSKFDLQNYFDDVLTFTFGEKEFKVDESNKTYRLYQLKMKELSKTKKNDETILEETFKMAFGDDYEEFKKIELPAKAYNDIAIKIMAAWTGMKEETIQKQMEKTIEQASTIPSKKSK